MKCLASSGELWTEEQGVQWTERKASFRDKRNVIRTASNSSTSLNEIYAELGIDVCPFFVHFFRNRRRSHTFQQDNAAINSSNSIKNLFASKEIKVLDWPACSPDLNPIENLWEMLVPHFKTAVQGEWDAVSIGEPKKLVATRPNRVVEVI
uniref:DDE_3 domain-containing protein n=1 Tax=Caenorhabditis japonica TaxID=281687 RepID=A0A8R1I6T6_CAEJA